MGWRSIYRYNMKNKNIIRLVNSLILLPAMTTMSVPAIGNNIQNTQVPQVALFQQQNIEAPVLFAFNQEEDEKLKTLKAQGEAIDAYFKKYDMPLEGTGLKMAEEAYKNDLDWRLIAAISVRESTGGKFACKKVKNSFLGWGSCKISFESKEQAIEVVSKNLGGNNPKTAHHYDDKTVKEILQKYNPPSIVPKYADQVMKIMSDIGPEDITTITNTQAEA